MTNEIMQEIYEMRKRIILAGKILPEYVKMASENGRDKEKYRNLNSLRSGTMNMRDLEKLYDYIQKNNFAKILEIGTLFGTSSYVMVRAMLDNGIKESVVYTCDRHRLIVSEPQYDKYIKYYCMKSSKMLSEIKHEKFDFIFLDAKLREGDAKIISKMCNPLRLITHDYNPKMNRHNKGCYNIKWMKEVCGKLRLVDMNGMALLEAK